VTWCLSWVVLGVVALSVGVYDFTHGCPWLGYLGCAMCTWAMCNAVFIREKP
jgi:hypothetical protein